MTEQTGRALVGQLVAGMERERVALSGPNAKAERFVNRREEQGQRKEVRGWRHDEARGKVESRIRGLAKSLERDRRAESLVRDRTKELEVGQELRREPSTARALREEMSRSQRSGRAAAHLRPQGRIVPDELLKHVSPLGWEHINLTGIYSWYAEQQMPKGVRPLRLPGR